MTTVNEWPIYAMGGLATLSMVAIVGIFWVGIFALLAGRDTVWECSWRWPARLIACIKAIGESRIISSARVAFTHFVTDEPRRSPYAPNSERLAAVPASRRPAAEHYLTPGARARQHREGLGPGSSRRAA
jgi:hypothetical protein